nr:putative ribonuclease H-like domain-containing protein [Tanacetum cinerariifolium]
SQKDDSDLDDEPDVLIIHSTPTPVVPIVDEATTQNHGKEEADQLGLAFPSLNLILGVGSAPIGSSVSAGSTPPISASGTPPMSPCASPISADRHSISAGKCQVSAGRPTRSAGRPAFAGKPTGSAGRPVSAGRPSVPAGRILRKLTSNTSSERFPPASSLENSDIHDGLKIFDCLKSGIFTSSSYDDDFSGPDANNLESSLNVKQKGSSESAFISYIHDQRNNHNDFQLCMFSCFLSREEPTTMAQALADPDWVEAMQAKIQQFKNQKVWILVTLPDGKWAIGTKWILKNKRDARGIVCRIKARLVAQGHRQEEWIDYTNVFAPVARIEAILLFLAFASFTGFRVYQMDVKSAFLYGKIIEEVYVTQTRGFEDPNHPKKVYKVVKVLYGLHQAPRAWYERFSTFLLKHGYRRGTIDKTLFIKKYSKDIMLVQVYVDDIIFGSTRKDWCEEFETLMQSEFEISSMGPLTFFLGLQVDQRPDGIFIHQEKYVADILKKFDLDNSKLAAMYLTATRPDIMFAVCAATRHQVTPKTSKLLSIKQIFKYLTAYPKLGNPQLVDVSFLGGGTIDSEPIARLWSTWSMRLFERGFCCLRPILLVGIVSAGGHSFLLVVVVSLHFCWSCDFLLVVPHSCWCLGFYWSYVIPAGNVFFLLLDDLNAIDTMTNEEIFAGLRDIGYTTEGKFTFFKNMFSPQWKFLIHTLIHCLFPKSGSWNQFASNIAIALICLSTGRKYNFSNMIFTGMCHNVSSHTKFLMYPRFLQLILDTDTEDTTPYPAPLVTKKIFANMRHYQGPNMPLLAHMLNRGEPVLEQAQQQAVYQPQPSPVVAPHPLPDPMPSPPRQSSPPSIPFGPAPNSGVVSTEPIPDIPSSYRPSEPVLETITSPIREDDTGGGSFHESPPRPTPATPPRTTLEAELKTTRILHRDAVVLFTKRIKKLESKLKSKKRKLVLSDSETEEEARQSQELDALLNLANAALHEPNFTDAAIPAGELDSVGGLDFTGGLATAAGLNSAGVDPSKGKAFATPSSPVSAPTSKELADQQAAILEAERQALEQELKQSIDAEQVYLDSLLAQRVAKEQERESMASEAQSTHRQAELDRVALNLTNEEWIGLVNQVRANPTLSAKLLGADVSEDTFSVRMVDLMNRRRKAIAKIKAKAKREKPMTPAQQKEFMRTFFKNQSQETTSVFAGVTNAAGNPIPAVTYVFAASSIPAMTPIAFGVSTSAGASGSDSEASVHIIELLDSPPKDTSLPLDLETEEQEATLRKSSRKKSIARRRTLPSAYKPKSDALLFDEDDPEAEFKRYLRQASDDDEPAEPVSLALVSDITTWEIIPTEFGLGEIHVLTRADGIVKRFSTLRELMYWAGRANLMVLYGLVSDKYKIERATCISLGLWIDLRILIASREERDASIIWDDQDQWQIWS